MNEVQIFDNPEFGSIRTLMIDDGPWFAGKDVAVALGYAEPTKAVREKVDTEDRGMSKMDTPSGVQSMIIINESGFYSLVLSSKLPAAKKFKHWVTSEVLPALRKTGTYTMQGTPERPLTRDDYIRAAEIIANCEKSRLPQVIGVLNKAGLDVAAPVTPVEPIRQINAKKPKTQPVKPIKREIASDIELMKLRLVLSRYEPKKVAKLIGVDVDVICSYRAGERHPYRERYEYLMETLDPKHEIVEEH